MKKLRTFLSNFWTIHIFMAMGLLALSGVLFMDNKYLIFFVVLSFAGAVCGSFIKVIDTIKSLIK